MNKRVNLIIGSGVLGAYLSAELLKSKQIVIVTSRSLKKNFTTDKKTNKTEISKIVAEDLAKKALEKNIKKIYFDRGKFKYHGRVKIFADTLRKNGMEF